MPGTMGHFNPLRIVPFVVEFLLTIFALAWFASAYPDKYRTTLWTAGGEHGWNSNPKMRIYYYANYEEPPVVPLIWSESLTESNLAIATLTVLVCLARGMLLFYKSLAKLLNPLYDVLLCGFWTYSAMAQSSSDLSEKDHWSIRPWYLERNCAEVEGEARDACVFAKVSYSFGLLLMTFYLFRSIFSILGLAYWCGQQGIIGRIADKLPITLKNLLIDNGYEKISLDEYDIHEYA